MSLEGFRSIVQKKDEPLIKNLNFRNHILGLARTGHTQSHFTFCSYVSYKIMLICLVFVGLGWQYNGVGARMFLFGVYLFVSQVLFLVKKKINDFLTFVCIQETL